MVTFPPDNGGYVNPRGTPNGLSSKTVMIIAAAVIAALLVVGLCFI